MGRKIDPNSRHQQNLARKAEKAARRDETLARWKRQDEQAEELERQEERERRSKIAIEIEIVSAPGVVVYGWEIE